MVNKKITELTELTSSDAEDVFAIVDVSEDETKKITQSNLLSSLFPYTFPVADGSANQIITTNGSGNLSWIDLNPVQTWLDPVIDFHDPTTLPSGDRYIASATANGWTKDNIYEWNGDTSTWDETIVVDGNAVVVKNLAQIYTYTTEWGTQDFTNYWQLSGNNLFNVNSGNIGIGTTTPEALLHIDTGQGEFLIGAIAPFSNVGIELYRNDVSITTGNPLGYIVFSGRDTTGNVKMNHASIRAEAAATHSAGNNPTKIVFQTTPSGSETMIDVLTITEDGDLDLGDNNLTTTGAGSFGNLTATGLTTFKRASNYIQIVDSADSDKRRMRLGDSAGSGSGGGGYINFYADDVGATFTGYIAGYIDAYNVQMELKSGGIWLSSGDRGYYWSGENRAGSWRHNNNVLSIVATNAIATDTMLLKANAFTFEPGATNTDMIMNFTGTSHSGQFKWMEDEDYFEFIDAIKISGGIKSSDGSEGITGTFVDNNENTITIKNGLITDLGV